MKHFLPFIVFLLLHACGQNPAGVNPNAGAGPGASGKGGSTARFAIVGDRLYTLAGSQLITFSLEKPEAPVALNQLQVAWDVETMFPYDRSLYLGARTGMSIYDLSNPDEPALLGTHSHQRACDPVVVQGEHAFVTLKSNSRCGGTANVLEVINITEPDKPRVVSRIPMFAPTGLAVHEHRLFICDGAAGLKVFDIMDPLQPQLTDAMLGQNCNDLIPHRNLLIATAADGIWQYRMEQSKLELLSILPWQG